MSSECINLSIAIAFSVIAFILVWVILAWYIFTIKSNDNKK